MKRKLSGIVLVLKANKDYLIRMEFVIEMDYLPILGMISGCATPDLALLRWIAHIKSTNPQVHHILGKNNTMVNMLLKAMYEDEGYMVLEYEDATLEFFNKPQESMEAMCVHPWSADRGLRERI